MDRRRTEPTTDPLGGHPRWPALARLVDAVLRPCCVLCGDPPGPGTDAAHSPGLCPPCRAELPRMAAACPQCASPGPFGALPCGACLRRPPRFSTAVAALEYTYPVDALVRSFKFHADLPAGAILADELLAAVTASAAARDVDVVVPVPLHGLRRIRRGFNQSEELARPVARALGLPLGVGLLKRTRRTAAQSGLDLATRRRNVRNAFRCGPVAGQRIALADDVLTTGTTLDECARCLRRSGAAAVIVWVAARVPPPGTR